MITSLSQLLHEFANAERETLNKYKISHPPTIGTMYEGLTANILNKSIFNGFNLKIVKNSFIEGTDTEYDVMLVVGDGLKIPHTDRHKYKLKNVIAIIQVKKNLYSSDLKDGFENLNKLTRHISEADREDYMGDLFQDAFRLICKKDISARAKNEVNEYEEAIYHLLNVESVLPVRIVWGYNGFVNEYNLRSSLIKYLNSNITTDPLNRKKGFGVGSFPNLIICGQYSIIKVNGMPFGGKILEDNWWPFLASSSYNPTYFFLELIWTRLTYRFNISSKIFGEDLTIEPAARFIDARIANIHGKPGWEYKYIYADSEGLKGNVHVTDWAPIEINEKQHAVLLKLGEIGEIDIINNPELEEFVKAKGYYNDLNQFISVLVDTGLVYIENNRLRFLTEKCDIVITPDGKVWAAENNSGRLTNWVQKKYG